MVSSEKHSDYRDQAQQIISGLAQREQELQERTEQAKAEAERVLENARAEALSILEAARSRVEQDAQTHRKGVAQRSLQLVEQKKKAAVAQAAELDKQAMAKQDQAVDIIVRHVFPEI